MDYNFKERPAADFQNARIEFQKWTALFQHTGLKPRRFIVGLDAVYISTIEGWFRIGFGKYSKPELNWLHRMLEHLEERAFNNWAVPWRKTIIWEEDNHCYLIQPWVMGGESFRLADPGAVQRVAEIMAHFYNCGKDYVETKGIGIIRERWSNIEVEWETGLRNLDKLKNEDFPEKSHGEAHELRKTAANLLKENLNNWRNSGINSLFEQQRRSGVLGHGRLHAQNIIWLKNDFYLLNWEYVAFQPRILDLAVLINDIAYWEPEWIFYLISEYARVQPFWPEEYSALQALLRYPQAALAVLERLPANELDRKSVKEAAKELARKERCLGKVWRELGTEKRWAGSSFNNSSRPQLGLNKLSMALSPLESWGDFRGATDTVIRVKNDAKLPVDVIERLTRVDQNRIVGGKAGNILKGAGTPPAEREIEPPGIEIQAVIAPKAAPDQTPPADEKPEPAIKKGPPGVIRWAGFPENVSGKP